MQFFRICSFRSRLQKASKCISNKLQVCDVHFILKLYFTITSFACVIADKKYKFHDYILFFFWGGGGVGVAFAHIVYTIDAH